jgi:pyrroline-5-carboxylate reductase
MTQKPNIALIGCGKMGGAMLRSWVNNSVANKIAVFDPAPPAEDFAGVTFYSDITAFCENAADTNIFIMAVKPQIMADVCTSIKPAVAADALILSIAAGQTISSFEERFGSTQPLIRVMPNTPAAIGKGMSVAVANASASEAQMQQADILLKAVGKIEWVEDEALLNAVTAVSGSGPAYIFHLIEAMAAAGEQAGLSAELSMTLARETVIGSAALAASEPETSAEQLRKNVTSPGGTTQAALDVLMAEKGLTDLMTRAITAAKKRGEELA